MPALAPVYYPAQTSKTYIWAFMARYEDPRPIAFTPYGREPALTGDEPPWPDAMSSRYKRLRKFYLIGALLWLVLVIIGFLIDLPGLPGWLIMLWMAVGAAVVYLSSGQILFAFWIARRFHDLGYSGWPAIFVLLPFICAAAFGLPSLFIHWAFALAVATLPLPIFGGIIAAIVKPKFTEAGQEGPNQYGPEPNILQE